MPYTPAKGTDSVNSKMPVEPNEKPLDKVALDELIQYSGFKVDLILQFSEEDDAFLVFAQYQQNHLIRQVYSQRNTPRKFKDVGRGIHWGKRMGFQKAQVYVNYQEFPED